MQIDNNPYGKPKLKKLPVCVQFKALIHEVYHMGNLGLLTTMADRGFKPGSVHYANELC